MAGREAQRDPAARPFWLRKRLDEMTRAEWESLCDGCAQCCRHKLEDSRTGAVRPTRIACRLLDLSTCRCLDYRRRRSRVPDCVRLTPDHVPAWLPATCAYRRVAAGKDLPAWHPLKTGDAESVHRAGISIRGRAIGERELPGSLDDYPPELLLPKQEQRRLAEVAPRCLWARLG
jgi:uncharacterized cysteine cluster protein YcgN (CxxCxxCC family)